MVESIGKDASAMRYHIGGKLLDRPELDNALGHSADRTFADRPGLQWLTSRKLPGIGFAN
jgi:hypothetical protein